jgi:hypothetical protein
MEGNRQESAILHMVINGTTKKIIINNNSETLIGKM